MSEVGPSYSVPCHAEQRVPGGGAPPPLLPREVLVIPVLAVVVLVDLR